MATSLSDILMATSLAEIEEIRKIQAKTQRVLAVFYRWPNVVFGAEDLSSLLNLERKFISATLGYLARTNEQVVRISRGCYMFVEAVDEVAVEESAKSSVSNRVLLAVDEDTLGRLVLKDSDGAFWVAEPLESEF